MLVSLLKKKLASLVQLAILARREVHMVSTAELELMQLQDKKLALSAREVITALVVRVGRIFVQLVMPLWVKESRIVILVYLVTIVHMKIHHQTHITTVKKARMLIGEVKLIAGTAQAHTFVHLDLFTGKHVLQENLLDGQARILTITRLQRQFWIAQTAQEDTIAHQEKKYKNAKQALTLMTEQKPVYHVQLDITARK